MTISLVEVNLPSMILTQNKPEFSPGRSNVKDSPSERPCLTSCPLLLNNCMAAPALMPVNWTLSLAGLGIDFDIIPPFNFINVGKDVL
jgi:hypothetical protein